MNVGPPELFPELDTPSLLIDLDAMERNLVEMAEVARAARVDLRPHTKTHKSPEIAAMQVAGGAKGITVAKIGEAEVMADAGLDDILIAFPIIGETKLRRLHALMDRARVRVSLDSVEVAQGLGRLGLERREPVEVLVEVDTGHHRMGRPPGAPTAELVVQVARVPGVEVMGLLTHEGHAYAVSTPRDLDSLITRLGLHLLETREQCRGADVWIEHVTVGSTPTARAVVEIPEVTEIRPGTYVFNDVQQMRLGVATEETCAAHVLAAVVARPWDDRFVIDAGTKCFTSDGGDGPPFPGRGVVAGRPDLRLDFLTEEHGIGHVEPGGAPLSIGDRLEIIPLHVCSTVNMFDVAYGVRAGALDHELRIEGRGKVQ